MTVVALWATKTGHYCIVEFGSVPGGAQNPEGGESRGAKSGLQGLEQTVDHRLETFNQQPHDGKSAIGR